MATSKLQRSTTIDTHHHAWYSRIAAANPLLNMAGMRRQAHEVYQRNYALLDRAQRQLQDDGIYLTDAGLVGRLLRMVIYNRIEITTVNDDNYCSSAVE